MKGERGHLLLKPVPIVIQPLKAMFAINFYEYVPIGKSHMLTNDHFNLISYLMQYMIKNNGAQVFLILSRIV